jgi:hypothetical protein
MFSRLGFGAMDFFTRPEKTRTGCAADCGAWATALDRDRVGKEKGKIIGLFPRQSGYLSTRSQCEEGRLFYAKTRIDGGPHAPARGAVDVSQGQVEHRSACGSRHF